MSLTIRIKLMLGFLAVLSLMILASALAYFSLNNINNSVSQILVHAHKYDMVDGLRRASKQFLKVNDSLIKGQIKDLEYYNSLATSVEKRIRYVGKLHLQEDEKTTLMEINSAFVYIKENTEQALNSTTSHNTNGIIKLFRDVDKYKSILLDSVEGLYDKAWRALDNITLMADKNMKSGTRHIIIFALIAIVVGIGISIYISHSITAPLLTLSRAASSVAKGDLDQRVAITRGDEIGELVTSFNQMISDLKTSRSKIEEYNKRLQEMVDERTVELEKTKEYLENILEYSEDMIITITLFDEIAQFNRGAEKKLGYDRKNILGTNIEHLFTNKDLYRKARQRVVEENGTCNFDTALMQKNGQIVSANITLSALRDNTGSTIGLIGICRTTQETI